MNYLLEHAEHHHDDRDRTRTCNPQIRSLMPYPLGHTATENTVGILNFKFPLIRFPSSKIWRVSTLTCSLDIYAALQTSATS